MDRDSTLLEEAYLKVFKESYWGRDEDESETIRRNYTITAFCEPITILNRTYIIHVYHGDVEVIENHDRFRPNIVFSYKPHYYILIWDVEKTPEIKDFYTEDDEYEGLSDEIINVALVNYPNKNPDFIEKYRYHPIYGQLIKHADDRVENIALYKWESDD